MAIREVDTECLILEFLVYVLRSEMQAMVIISNVWNSERDMNVLRRPLILTLVWKNLMWANKLIKP